MSVHRRSKQRMIYLWDVAGKYLLRGPENTGSNKFNIRRIICRKKETTQKK